MNASNRDALSAVVARQRGRARLRSVTIAAGAAGLVAAGAIAYTLPSGVTHATTGTSSAATGGTSTGGTSTGGAAAVHTTSGGSSVATAAGSGSTGSASAPTASSGAVHATSGGS
jgi:hypothetical protein